MTRSYYTITCRLDRAKHHMIWFTNDEDGLVTSPGGGIVRFDDLDALRRYAMEQSIALEAQEPTYL